MRDMESTTMSRRPPGRSPSKGSSGSAPYFPPSSQALPPFPANLSFEEGLIEFGRRIQWHLDQRGWLQADLARATAPHTKDKKPLRRDLISNYVRGRNEPRSANLQAIARALKVDPADLYVRGETTGFGYPGPASFSMQDRPDGMVSITIGTRVVPQDVAFEIMRLLAHAHKSEGSS